MEPSVFYQLLSDLSRAERRAGLMATRHGILKVGDLVKNATFDSAENKGLYALAGHILVQPKYQRYYIYDDGKRDVAVIESILKGRPLGMICLYLPGSTARDGIPMAELLDGQQRLTTIIRFCTDKFSVNIDGKPFNFSSLDEETKNLILDTEIPVTICAGGEIARNDWFKTINMPGVSLTVQEILNCIYAGEHVEALKEKFSHLTPFLTNLALHYIKGDPARQEIVEAAIKMVKPDVEAYLAEHRHESDITEIDNKFHAVIEWADTTFKTYYKEQKGLEWGRLYDTYHSVFFSPDELDSIITELMADERVTSKKGVFEYALQAASGAAGDKSLLHIRLFDDSTKRTVYTRQTESAKAEGKSNCPMCAMEEGANRLKLYGIKEMDADHASAWSKGGETVIANCVMLCSTHNRMKGNR